MENYYHQIEQKYGQVYCAMYNLSVQHDNLMGKCVDWNFMEKTANEYVELKKDQGKMTDQEAKDFKAGWNHYLDRAFN